MVDTAPLPVYLQEMIDAIQAHISHTGSNLENVYTKEQADGRFLNKSGKAVSAANADKVNGLTVETAVPAGAVFTDTIIKLSDAVDSTDSKVAGSSMAVKTAFDKGVEALSKANANAAEIAKGFYTKVEADSRFLAKAGKAVSAANADKVNNLTVETAVPANAKFTDTITKLSDAVNSDAADVAASSKAAKTAYQRGSEALTKANENASMLASMTGMVSDLGALDASAGELPSKPTFSAFWHVTKAGLITLPGDQSGTHFEPGDALFYTKTDDSWYKLDHTERPITSDLTNSSTTTAASAKATKTLQDTKLDKTAKATDADKLDGKDSTYFGTASAVSTADKKGADSLKELENIKQACLQITAIMKASAA